MSEARLRAAELREQIAATRAGMHETVSALRREDDLEPRPDEPPPRIDVERSEWLPREPTQEPRDPESAAEEPEAESAPQEWLPSEAPPSEPGSPAASGRAGSGAVAATLIAGVGLALLLRRRR